MSHEDISTVPSDRGDEVRSRLPDSKKLGFWSNTFILWGLVLTVSSLLVGGLVGSQLSFKEAMLVIAMAGIFNSVIAILIGIIGTRTGYTSAMLFRYSYGNWGVVLPNFILSITTVVWFAVILNLTRDATIGILGISQESAFAYWGITLLMAVVFLIPAYKTMKWIAYVDYLAVPAIVVILIVTIWGALDIGGGLKAIIARAPMQSASALVVFTSAAGGWLHANTVISDFTRFYKNERQAGIGLFLTYGVLMVLQYVGATLGALATGEWNIFLIMDRFGLLHVSFFAIFLGSWSTAMAAIYFGANMMAAPPIPQYKNEETNRKLVLLISWALALFFSWYGPDQIFNFFLQFLSWLIGPIAVTVIIDYWLFPERKVMYEDKNGSPDMKINPAAFLSWITGFLIGYFSQEFFISLINGMIAAGIIYYGWMRMALNRKSTPESQIRNLFRKKVNPVSIEPPLNP
ncbi:cytosine permease [Dyadobacter sp. CY327]|uniref:purine-cytosine permease family protein n=1 Tax=Dyadobacter sp. CY327 TaxID=2907301 RepID=UPI001F42B4EF|nr:cytosine permease [Dyadobacter sp. CY327]MCE7070833.1 cytosine permease [Dyadobacter sp. CY327]